MYCVNCGSPLPADGVCPACGQVHQMPTTPAPMPEQGRESEAVLSRKDRIKKFLFPGGKRMNRKRFIIRALTMMVIMPIIYIFAAIVGLLLSFLTSSFGVFPFIMVIMLFPFLLLALVYGVFLYIWRLHDLNLSVWYLLFFNIIGWLLAFLDMFGGGDTVFQLLSILFSIAICILLYCVPGTKGPNKYGEDPLAMTGDR